MVNEVWFEVRVHWWVKWMMRAGCIVAWALRGQWRVWWIGVLTQRIVPWMIQHGVTTRPVKIPKALNL